MSHLIISKKNEVYLQVKAEPHVYYELADQFTFQVPGAKFMPQYRNKFPIHLGSYCEILFNFSNWPLGHEVPSAGQHLLYIGL